MNRIFNDQEAARHLKMSAQTLRNWRCQGKGPAYFKIGKCVRYQLSDLNEFIATNKIKPENPR